MYKSLLLHTKFKSLLFVVLLSQLTTITIVSLDFLHPSAYVLTQESEEPRPNEGKNTFDIFEENKFIVTNFVMTAFFSGKDLNTLHIESFLFEVENTLDSPPPEAA